MAGSKGKKGASIKRCGWCLGDALYEQYHDEEWGVPLLDDRKLFEFLVLDAAQAGLSWRTVLHKREGYRKAFDGFDAKKVARYTPAKIEKLLQDASIIRNRLKVQSAVNNARAFLDIQERVGSFTDYIWQFSDHRPHQNRFRTLEEVPATSARSDAMSKQMKKDGFNFVGSTICYAFMQAAGMVNDHLVSCHRHEACRLLGQ